MEHAINVVDGQPLQGLKISQDIKASKISTCIAGFLVEHTKEKVSIYQALLKKLVSGTVALALLEAQAATGYIIDPTTNQRLSVEEAIHNGVVGPEYHKELTSATNAVTGYKLKDETVSLFQAFKKSLVVKNDAIRFLEAQIATGGVIDPVSSNCVSLSEAYKLNYIDQEMYKILSESTEAAKCYLDPNTQEYSTYQELLAKCITDAETGLPLLPLKDTLQGLRKPVTSDQLLMANIIDQALYDDIKQGKMTLEKVGKLQNVQQYLHGLGSIDGVYIESTKEKMSIYHAMKQNFLTSDSAVALLEAQAATGFITDPVSNAKFFVTQAIQEGLVGLELKEKLVNAERAVTGFTDPYTGNKISLFQAIKKELIDKKQGLNLLEVQVATGGIIDPVHSHRVPIEVAYKQGLFNEEMSNIISDPINGPKGFLDPNTNEMVTYLELKKRCTVDPDSRLYFLPLKLTFQGLRVTVTSEELLDSMIIDKQTYKDLQQGNTSVQQVAERESVKQYLEGTGCIAGVAILSTNERKSIYQAMKEHLVMPGTSMALLEAQAATGFLVDPVRNVKFTVDDAVKISLVGPEFREKLLSAEKAVTGYKDPYTGTKISLFQAIKKGFIGKDHGIHLLEAQIATGGIIDPVQKHRLPLEVAYKRGYFDEEMNKSLLDQTDDTKGFFDPNSKKNMTYAQLLQKCVVDPHTGLCLFPLFDKEDVLKTSHTFIDYQTQVAFKTAKVTVTSGKYKGQPVSLWKLLFSDYFTTEQRESFVKQYKSGSISVEELASKIATAIQQLVSTTKITFEGLRESVTPGQLLNSEIINKDLFEKLQQGETSAKDVVKIDTVKKYLQGTGSISGLIVTETQEKIGIYQARKKGLLRPGTSLILLEAQAATGFVIDPVENRKYSVEEALRAKVIGLEFYEKLLSAEKSVTGYKDPYTDEMISLFQAMSKDLIVKEHGIRLLEAQIATGGIIDPINSHRIPVEVAYKRGYFDKKMNIILSDPSDDTKGFFDPNTNENLTYMQLKEKCIIEPSTELCLLPLHSKKSQFSVDDFVKDSLRNLEIYVKYGRFEGQTLSAWVLINSEYFSEWKRRDILQQYKLRKMTLEQITTLIKEEIKKCSNISFPAIRGQVNISQLLESEIIDKELFEQILEGKVTTEDVLKMEEVQKHLHGFGILGGIIMKPSNERIDFYEATKKNILSSSTILPLLEAQAATGFIIDPVNNQKLSVEEALRTDIIGPQFYEKLLSAEEAVTGYTDPYTGEKISLFQAMKKGLVDEKHATQLLEVQLATGGIIDPVNNFHLPVAVANKHGYFNEEMHKNLSTPTDANKTYYDPTTKEMVTYAQLISRSQQDKTTGIHLLPVHEDFFEVPMDNMHSDEEVRRVFKNTRIEERNMTLWDLIHSGYFTEEQRNEILEEYKSKKSNLQELTAKILQIVKDNEIKVTTHISFKGLRGNVPAVRLLDVGIISQKTFEELAQGLKTIEEVSEMESVKKCLQGTGCITGVFLQPTKEKMSIYQAMKKNFIMPANGLMLLEAQAATGFVIDPILNQRLSVDSAVKTGVVGPELHEKLLVAESAVIGYTDPYTGNKISLGQAISKERIPKAEGIPLLQAQVASGGIIDPTHCHYVPLKVAYKMGFLDEEMDLSNPTQALKIYFDPNTKENLTYLQLKERCHVDTDTGLLLLSISESAAFYAEAHTIAVLKSVNVNVEVGRFKGQPVSVWDLLNSEYISMSKLKELLCMYNSTSSDVLQQVIKTVTTIIQETESASKNIKFKGLRKQVSASDLFQSEVIDKQTLDELSLGKKTIMEVTEMDNVQRYLQGTNCIAGVLLQSTNKKISIYEAMWKRILRPGTALVLLEAQAATGFIIDPVKNEKLSVDEAMAKGLIGHEIYDKLLSAEKAVTGYTDPNNEEKISLFQAMNRTLIIECHGIRLLEAQIATGGIIDPVHSHRVPVEVAYKRGYFNEEMNKILSDPSDDTKGFFDPNTHENLTYLQLVERCIQDPETGLYLLQVVKKGENYFYITDKMKEEFRSKTLQMYFGKFKNQTVSIWEILTSHYITDLKRRELVKQYTMGVLTMEQLVSILTTLIQENEVKSSGLKFKGLRGEVAATDLFNAEIIDKKTLDNLKESKITVEKVAQMDSVKRYLEGTSCIAGVLVSPNNETISVNEAMKRGILEKDIGLKLLEAQAATGFLIDPVTNQKFSVSEALSVGLVNNEVQEQLQIAEKAVTGFTDPKSDVKISLFQAIQKNIVKKDHGLYLLEAQVATGGIVDPIYSHRVPLEVAYKKGYLDEYMYIMILDAVNGKKGFVDPNTKEKITYKTMLERCIKDPKTGMYLLQLVERRDDYFYIDDPTRNVLKSTKLKMNVGKFKDQDISLWELLCSDYISEEKRKELIKKYKTETSSILKTIINVILALIEEKERSRNDIWFQGLRQQITASELYNAEIINKETLERLEQSKQTVSDIAKNNSVKRYLEGTSCIAGVLVPSKLDPTKREKMTIYDAMLKHIMRPDTAMVLLEAQAATGFVTDPVKNKKLSVDEALSARLIGHEIYDKLLSAERGVTGYTDPNTGDKISLFQAIKKDLIVKDHGIHLLEAQIATGGIIDPVHSHRVPVKVAYKRGYFDEEMNQILSDPTDDTKGFFDPNTNENLTYMQLLMRCTVDPDTGLHMLEMKDNRSSEFQIDKKMQATLQSKTVHVTTGQFQGKNVSVWELLYSQYISTEKREELLKNFRSGTLSIEELITIIISIITETEQQRAKDKSKQTTSIHVDTTDSINQHEQNQTLLQSEKVDVTVGDFNGQSVSVWELLNSHYISEDKRKELLEKMKSGTLTIQEIISIITTIIKETELKKREQIHKGQEVQMEQSKKSDQSVHEDEIKKALQSISIHVKKGQFQGQEVSVWDLLHSKYITQEKRQELLGDYKLTVQEIMNIVIQTIEEIENKSSKSSLKAEYSLDKVRIFDSDEEIHKILKTIQVDISVGEFKGQKHSVWDLLTSKYISEGKRKELLGKLKSGTFSINEMIKIIIAIIEETENRSKSSHNLNGSSKDQSAQDTDKVGTIKENQQSSLKSVFVSITKGQLKGQKLSVWELLNSKYITGNKKEEILQKYMSGAWTIDKIIKIITTIINETEDKKDALEKTEIVSTATSLPKPEESTHTDEQLQKALNAIKVNVPTGQFQGPMVALWEILHSEYIPENTRKDQLNKHQVTVEKTKQVLTKLVQEPEAKTDYQAMERALELVTTELSVGEFKGQKVSLWALLHSKYISEEKRKEMLEKYKSGALKQGEILKIVITIIEEAEERSRNLKFKGFRRQVTATELLQSEIIDQSTLNELTQGSKTVEQVTQMDSVKRYLGGTSCIAGVLVPSKKDPSQREKMDIYSAMLKRILRPGTALVLLEAQAATGFVIDPVHNKKLSVDEALSAALIGHEIYDKLLSAEKGVTGYTDPYTGDKISLFQAMQKDLIVKDHGIRLLEAQIATGGIIDPVHSHRVPVEVAYKRGYFDEEMNQILSDPTDDTKGFFDPNTHENLTYLQLLMRCTEDPDTGLHMLEMKDKRSSYFQIDKKMQTTLQSKTVHITTGQFQGKNVSVWELLYSRYISMEKREELLKKFQSGTLSIEELMTIIISIITETEKQRAQDKSKQTTSLHVDTTDSINQHEQIQTLLLSEKVNVTVGDFNGQSVSVWELLNSHYISEDKRKELLEKMKSGTLTIQEIISIITTTLKATELKKGEQIHQSQEVPVEQSKKSDQSVHEDEIQKALQSISIHVKKGQFQGQEVSVWDLLHSKYFTQVKRQELLGNYKLTVQDIMTIVIQTIEEIENKGSKSTLKKEFNLDEMRIFDSDEEIHKFLQTVQVDISVGDFKGPKHSVWDLLTSKYISEGKRKELLGKLKSGTSSINEMIKIIIAIIEETENRSSHNLNRTSKDQSAQDTDKLGTIKENQQSTLKSVFMSITKGQFKGQKLSVWELLNSKYITGVKKEEILQKYMSGAWTVDEIIKIITTIINETEDKKDALEKTEIVSTATSLPKPEESIHTDEQLQKALNAIKVNVPTGQFQGQRVPLWEILHSEYIPENKRKDQLNKHQVTVENTKQVLTQLVQDPEAKTDYEAMQRALELVTTELNVGEFKGQKVSLWALLHSKYISEEKRQEMREKYKSGALKQEEILRIIITIIEEAEERSHNLKFKGFRRQVTATELLQSEIIDQSTLNELTQGSKTVEQVTQMDSVKRYLGGTSCIAGVLVPSKKDPSQREKMDIYSAMLKRILRPGTALVLLEAQAATGFVIDPLHNKKLSVDEALSAGLIGHEIYDKLLSAEKGVTGYTDPNTGDKISLFQAMQKDLIVKDHGIRLLEAQIATGGIIDPVHSHRVPVEVAYKRGYFDEEMNQILSDPTDDTKGFFDPNTHENLTYLQLLMRCTEDPDTGLHMLEMTDKRSSYFQIDKKMQTTLQSKTVHITTGLFQGKNVSVWELLYSRYISMEKREELLKKFRSGTLSIEELITIIISIITETEKQRAQDKSKQTTSLHVDTTDSINQHEQNQTLLQSEKVDVTVGDFNGQSVSVWELLTSHYISEDKRKELLEKMKSGTLTIQEIISIITTIIKEIELKKREQINKGQKVQMGQSKKSDQSVHEDEIQKALQSISIHVKKGQFQGQEVSVWDLLHSKYITQVKRQELLGNYKVSVQDIMTFVIQAIEEIENKSSKSSLKAEYSLDDIKIFDSDEEIHKMLKTIQVDISVGEFKGQKHSVWDLLTSKYIPEEKRKELLGKLKSGTFSINEMIKIIIAIIEETENRSRSSHNLNRSSKDQSAQDTDKLGTIKENQQSSLKSVFVSITKGQFKGQKLSVWELLNSKYITGGKKEEILQKYMSGAWTVDEIIKIITTIINETEDKKDALEQTEIVSTATSLPKPEDSTHTDEQLQKALNVTLENTRKDQLNKHQVTVEKSKQVLTKLDQNPEAKTDDEMRRALELVTTELSVGEFKGQKVSLWALLHSKYITEEKRKELLEKYKSGALNQGDFLRIIITIIEETEERSHNLKFKGFRRQVTATELLQSEIIDQSTLNELTQGSKTVEQVTQMDSVKRYLGGTSCIAGVFFPSKKDPSQREKMDIYSAMLKRILRPGTALVLLEAQAATGFVIDPVHNKKLSVDEALSAGLIGHEIYDKLLSAEKGVTGYTDPNTGDKISLFQAMQKDLIVKEHGIRLLEAQIATGGIIDPVHSHRVPVEVAYKRGYFDEEMNQILSDPTDDTKGFFDPNTHENLTYLQLLMRCTEDPDTGLHMLEMTDKRSSYFQIDKKMQTTLQSKTVHITTGLFQGKNVSVWELLYSRYISMEKREELLKKFRSGTLSIEELITIIISIITETEKQRAQDKSKQTTSLYVDTTDSINQHEQNQTLLQSEKVDVTVGDFNGQSVSVWELLNSHYISEDKRKELLEKMKSGTLTIQEIISIITTIIKEIELKKREQIHQSQEVPVEQSKKSDQSVREDEIQKALQSISIHVKKGQFQGQEVSVWDLLHSKYFTQVKRQELLGNYKLTVQDIMTIVIQTIEEIENKGSKSTLKKEFNLDEMRIFDSDEEIHKFLQTVQVDISVGDFKGPKHSVWDLLTSKYISEGKRKELLGKLKSGTSSINEMIKIIIAIIEETENRSSHNLNRTSKDQSAQDTDRLGTIKENQQSSLKSVFMSITKGQFKGQKLSVWELLNSKYITGVKKEEILQKYMSGAWTVDEIIKIITTIINETEDKKDALEKTEIVSKATSLPKPEESTHTDEQLQKALNAIKVNVPTGHFQGQRVPLWEILHSEYIPENKRKDQLNKHQVTVENTKQVLTQLVQDPEAKTDYEAMQRALELVTTELSVGEFKGQKVSLWALLHSKYISEEKRKEMLEKYKSGALKQEEILRIIITIIEEAEERSHNLKFKGFRRQVTATELLQSEIIDQSTLNELTQGSKTVEQVTQMDSVKRYLGGTSCIAGVFVPSKKDPSQREKMDIYSAMLKRILRPGTALVLLEAQAATGFVIDPLQNKKLSVDEALSAGLIGHEIYDKLLSAEKGVTGYTDPNTGDKISLFQAMQKDLIVKDHGIRLLEAQIATGGIIDPVHSHRVPVEVAYKRGYFDEEMNQILSDPTDDTKGFFDPNTHENLTYLQLLMRCTEDPDTGLHMLEMKDKRSSHFQIDKKMQTTLQSKTVHITTGQFQGKNLSVWELLYSRYISMEKREELLKKFRSSTLSIEELMTIIISIITETEKQRAQDKSKQTTSLHVDTTDSINQHEQNQTLLQSEKVDVTVGDFNGQSVSVWELLNSHYISEDKRKELLEKMKLETLTIQEIISIISTIIKEIELKKREQIHKGQEVQMEQSKKSDQSVHEDEIQKALQSISIHVKTGQFQGQEVSVWDLLHSKYITQVKRQELLGNYKLTVQDIMTFVIQTIEEIENKSSKSSLKTEYNLDEMRIFDSDEEIHKLLKTIQVDISVGEFKGQKHSVWDLLTSKYISEGKRKELLGKLKSGTLSINQMIKIIIAIIEATENRSNSSHNSYGSSKEQSAQDTDKVGTVKQNQQSSLQSVFVSITKGQFKGQKLSVWELLNSKYITGVKKEEILQKYMSGAWTIGEIIEFITSIINETEDKKDALEKTKIVSIATSIPKPEESTHTDEQLQKALNVTLKNTRKDQLNKHQATVEKTKQVLTKLDQDPVAKTDDEIRRALELVTTELSVGEFKGQKVSLWALLHSKYITEEKRKELLEKYKSGALNQGDFLRIIITIIEETEERSHNLKFKGFRRQVTATELLQSEIIDQSTLNELTQGSKTVEQVTQMDSVKRYLEGTSCIAGVFVPSKKDPSQREKMDIYSAMLKRILRPGTALVLLEAQAATGFVIDPLHNKKLSVDEALSAGLIGHEIYDKLLSAEKGVTGYTDPNTGDKISLFQAMQKDLIVKDHGIRLLEAQIATGGIIDPVHSHRVPVEVAYKRGYFDEEMNQILSDPSDDTKGFFDPNTHENLTYLQLVKRCIQDPDTGLYMLEVAKK
ncbi:epiplakin [Ascaphus truei]|uniref:epiplakin n=1 Tax=Ascaphus truei TaxID=8439 RepID=UPI003F592852